MKRVGIVGYGVVGHALAALFGTERVTIYDKFRDGCNGAEQRQRINACDLALVAVPTPQGPDGAAELDAIEDVVGWLQAPICIKSTVPPGTVDRLVTKTGKSICFSPEYVGETTWHPFKQIETHGFLIVGGEPAAAQHVVRVYQEVLGPAPQYRITSARTAELVKYMENCFFATKVAFVNQIYELAQGLRVDYNEVRELWLLDGRVNRSHTLVTDERGFGGRCLPKDLAALIAVGRQFGGAPLLEAVQAFNLQVRAQAAPRPALLNSRPAISTLEPVHSGSGNGLAPAA